MSSLSQLSRYRYKKSQTGAKRKQSSTSSPSDIGASPELRANSRLERKKQKQVSKEENSEMARPVTLEEIHAQLEKLATKEEIKKVTEELSKVTDTLMKRVDLFESKLFDMETVTDKLNSEVNRLKKDNNSLRDELEQRRKEVAALRTAQNDHEQHGRSWNIRVYGIQEERGGEETSEKCLQKCVKLFGQQLGVPVSESDLEIAHRAGRQGGVRPRPILVRFYSRRKKRTGTGSQKETEKLRDLDKRRSYKGQIPTSH